MKVLFLSNGSHGLYGFRKELITELMKTHTVSLFTRFSGNEKELLEMGCELFEAKMDRRGVNPITDLSLFLQYKKIIEQLKPDLVITYTIKPNIYGGLACRLKKVPYAVNITGLGTAFQKEGVLKKLVVTLYKLALKKAKVVFFENSGNKQIITDLKICQEAQCKVLNGAGVNLETYQLQPYPKCETTHFLFIGRIMKEKGVDELFSAMERLISDGENCVLDMVGGYEEDYERVISKYETFGWLKYHGYQKDVRPFINAAHCFVLPSWHEGMANTNLESAASGRALITSNIPGCKEAVIDGVSGLLCESQNADSLYLAMKKFLTLSFEERKKMGIAGRKHMEDVFDKRKVVKETIEKL